MCCPSRFHWVTSRWDRPILFLDFSIGLFCLDKGLLLCPMGKSRGISHQNRVGLAWFCNGGIFPSITMNGVWTSFEAFLSLCSSYRLSQKSREEPPKSGVFFSKRREGNIGLRSGAPLIKLPLRLNRIADWASKLAISSSERKVCYSLFLFNQVLSEDPALAEKDCKWFTIHPTPRPTLAGLSTRGRRYMEQIVPAPGGLELWTSFYPDETSFNTTPNSN